MKKKKVIKKKVAKKGFRAIERLKAEQYRDGVIPTIFALIFTMYENQAILFGKNYYLFTTSYSAFNVYSRIYGSNLRFRRKEFDREMSLLQLYPMSKDPHDQKRYYNIETFFKRYVGFEKGQEGNGQIGCIPMTDSKSG